MGMLPDRLPGYQAVTDPKARAALEGVWRAKVPAAPGVGADTLLCRRRACAAQGALAGAL